mgnify:CR=1 FL=1
MPGWDIQIRGGFDPIKFEKSKNLLDNPVTEYLLAKVEEISDRIKTLLDTPYPPASVAGEPPHRRTGTLQESVLIEDIQRHSVTLSELAPYAFPLEFGSIHMLPRPHFYPTVMEMSDEISRDLATILVDYFRRAKNDTRRIT